MLKKVLKFAITGGLGTVTNLLLFFLLADMLHINATIASIACFFVACTQNYIINHIWTFKMENGTDPVSLRLWMKFVIASLAGLAINITVLNVALRLYSWKYNIIPQALGILAGMILNFIFSNFFVFRKRLHKESMT